MKGYHIAYYHDIRRIHYWKDVTNEYHTMATDLIISSETGWELSKRIILERTGDSNWYIKNTKYNDTPERTAAWIKSLKCDEHSVQ